MNKSAPLLPAGRALGALTLAAALGYTLWIVAYPVFDYDLYWHLANGREMLARGEPIQRELFSYTHPAEPFPHLYHAWLAQGLFYLLWQAGGGLTLLGLKLAVTGAVTALVYRASRDWQATPVTAGLFTAWAVLAGWFRFVERPELFSLLGMAALGAIFAGHLAAGRRALWLALLPPLMVLWDCLHGAVYGFALLLIVVAAENLKPWLPRQQLAGWKALPRERLHTLNLAFAATIIACILNPYGLTSYLGFLDVVTGQASYDAGYTKVMEFQPPDWADFKPFYLLLGAGVLVFALAARFANATHVLIFVAFGLLAARISRTTGAFVLVATPFIAATVDTGLQRCGIRWRHLPLRPALATLTALALLGYGVKVKHFEPESPQTFGFKVDDRFLPAGSVAFIKDQKIRGNMYNTGHFGGYLAFHLHPERPIFQYNLPMIFGDTYRYAARPQELASWDINYAVVGAAQELDRLFPRAAWARVFREGAAVLVLRRSPENAAMIERYELRHFHPLMDGGQFRRALADPVVARRLILELGDYLTYRRDARWVEELSVALTTRPDVAADAVLAPVVARATANQRQATGL